MPLYTSPQLRILGASAVAVSGSADTNENTLATINVPAGAMGLNGILRISTLWTMTNSANNKTCRIRFSGAAGTQFYAQTFTTVATLAATYSIANRNSASSQLGNVQSPSPVGGLGSMTGAFQTGAIDTSAATSVVITGTKASAGEVLTLESYLVELIVQ